MSRPIPTWAKALLALVALLVVLPLLTVVAIVGLGALAGLGFYSATQQAVGDSRHAVVQLEVSQLQFEVDLALIKGRAAACGSEAEARAALQADGGLKAIPGTHTWDACIGALGVPLDPSYGRFWVAADADGRLRVNAVADVDQDGTASLIAGD